MARRTKYTPEVVRRLCDAIAIGATYELACKYAGISYELFRQWRDAKVAFLEALEDAEGRAVVGWLAKIEQAANAGAWQAAAWKLERRYPHVYGRTVQQVEGHVTSTVDATVTHREALRAHVEEADVERLTRALLGSADG